MQLIRAKLLPPRLTADLVPRPRLIQQLNAGLSRGLTLVSAPAGFGKTTLLAEWAQQAPCPVAWVTLDHHDDDVRSFLSYVVAAVATVFPHSCLETQSLLNAPTLPPATALVATLANDLFLLAGELILVLDDYHTLQQMAIHSLLDSLIAYLPPAFHLALGTRSSPPLSLVSLRARGQLCEVRQSDLRFTPQETLDFFAKAGHVTLDEQTLTVLGQRSEGWPAGLRLFHLSARAYADLRSFTTRFAVGDTDLMTYFIDQVLAFQSLQMQGFLLTTAIVERFSLPLYRALAQNPEEDKGEGLLAQALRENLFVVALGEGWYRYHPLFRELLLHRLEQQFGSGKIAELHYRASGWYEEQNQVTEAIQHALWAGDEKLAVAILARHRAESVRQSGLGQWQELERWIALFPQHLVDQHPILAISKAWHFRPDQRFEYLPILRRVEQRLAEAEQELELDLPMRRSLLGELHCLYSDVALYQGQFQDGWMHAQRSLELLPLDHALVRSFAYVFLVLGLQCTGNMARVQETLQTGLLEDSVQNGDFGRPLSIALSVARFGIDFLALDLAAAQNMALQMVLRGQQRGPAQYLSWGNYYLGRLAYVSNRLDEARYHFAEVVAHPFTITARLAVDSHLGLALIAQAQAMPDEAIRLAKEVSAFASELGALDLIGVTRAFDAHLALLQGRTETAVQWATRASRQALYVPNVLSEHQPFTLVRVLMAEGSNDSLTAAAVLLQELQETARRCHALLPLTELLALQAVLHDMQGESGAALEAIHEAISLAHLSRPVRVFTDMGLDSSRRLALLLRQLEEIHPAQGYIRLVIGALSSEPPVAPQTEPTPPASVRRGGLSASAVNDLLEPLSRREAEILVLIEQGLTNKQIGQQLYLAEKTVENHIHNIYQKLGVRSRTQAVRRASELHLFGH